MTDTRKLKEPEYRKKGEKVENVEKAEEVEKVAREWNLESRSNRTAEGTHRAHWWGFERSRCGQAPGQSPSAPS